MKVLITGKGNAGSWIVRGEQLGNAMGATVKSMATAADMRKHDVVIVVKKTPPELIEALRVSGVPWVYDIVDAYPQPECSMWTKEHAQKWLRHHVKTLNPKAVIFPNRKMREDLGTGGGYVVYHHYRPGITARTEHRKRIEHIGYEGSAKYMDAWLRPIMQVCEERHIKFHVNPAHISDLDVIVAMRGGVWDGYAQRHWKSNVKLANAHAAGVPFIGAVENGYAETACGAEYWADTPQQLAQALDWLADVSVREEVSKRFKLAAYTVEHAAHDMLGLLHDIM